ncbi:MAG: hypothetical protein RR425_02460 [Erysipelotrichales bacterium]
MNKLFYGFINCFSAFVFIILIYNLSAITTNCMSLKAYYNDYKNNQETYFIIETEGDGLNEMISNYKALMNALDSEAITTMQHKDNTDFTEITYDFKSLIKLGYLDQKEISDIKECVYVYNGKALKKNGYEIKREILPENLNCSFYDKDINFSQESYMIGDKHLSEKESVYFSNLEDNFLIQNIVVKNKSKVEIEKVIDEVYKGSDQDTKPKVLSYYENYSSDIFSTIDGLSKLIVLFVIYIVIFVYVLITYIYFIFEFFSKHLSIATFMGLRNSLIYKPIIINILLINVIVFLITNLLSQFYWINNVVFTIVFIIQVIIIIKFSKKYYENEIIESLKEL